MENSRAKITAAQFSSLIEIGSLNINGQGIEALNYETNDIIIKNLEISGICRLENRSIQPHRQSIEFNNCIFNDKVTFNNLVNYGKILFVNCHFLNNLEATIYLGHMHFIENCIFDGSTKISSQKEKGLIIENAELNNSLTLSGIFNSIIFLDISSKNKASNDSSKIISNTVRCDLMTFENIEIWSIILQDQSAVNNECTFNRLKIKFLIINQFIIGLNLNIKKSQINSFKLDNINYSTSKHRHLNISENCDINHLNIALHMLENTTISNSTIRKIELWGTNELESSLSFFNTTTSILKFNSVLNKGKISISNINFHKNSKLIFESSNMGATDFISCDFSNGILEFTHSKITDVFISESKFPDKVHKNGKYNAAQSQLAFGQLHTAYKKQGDTVNSLEYQSREISSHYNKLKLFSNDFFTVANLYFNKISNNFGRSWAKGAFFTFGIGFLIFSLLVLSIQNSNKLEVNSSLWLPFLKFMNPIRSFETEKLFSSENIKVTYTLTLSSYIIDFFGKIFITYGYYQTIQAFRKFGRN